MSLILVQPPLLSNLHSKHFLSIWEFFAMSSAAPSPSQLLEVLYVPHLQRARTADSHRESTSWLFQLYNKDELFRKIVKPDKYYQHCYFMQYTVCKAYDILSNTVSRRHQICPVLKYLK